MVKCGELPCTISNVAHNLGKEVYSISTTRAQLISKGIIYPVRYKELDFTVPEFSGYIQRLDEYKKKNASVILAQLKKQLEEKGKDSNSITEDDIQYSEVEGDE